MTHPTRPDRDKIAKTHEKVSKKRENVVKMQRLKNIFLKTFIEKRGILQLTGLPAPLVEVSQGRRFIYGTYNS